MVFSSMVFLCIFLPAVFILYYLCPGRLRNLFLFAASLLFYSWGEPVYIFIMIFSTVFDYVNGRLIGYFRTRERTGAMKLVLLVSIAGNLSILGFFKYTDFIISAINSFAGTSIGLLDIALPVGISFYTFQTMSLSLIHI